MTGRRQHGDVSCSAVRDPGKSNSGGGIGEATHIEGMNGCTGDAMDARAEGTWERWIIPRSTSNSLFCHRAQLRVEFQRVQIRGSSLKVSIREDEAAGNN